MLKLHEIREIIKLIDTSNIEEFELENEGTKLILKKPKSGTVSIERVITENHVSPGINTFIPPVQQEKIQVQHEHVTGSAEPSNAKIDENLHKITSPMVGTFYKSPSPEAGAYITKGDKVSEKDVVCIVEAMKLMNEIEAEVRGEIVEILVENGQLVEYGQPLFLVRPE
ncbi:MAG: acetyl-CoA carboxylase biotin carboxyl carrier protein [Bacilli bacterium]